MVSDRTNSCGRNDSPLITCIRPAGWAGVSPVPGTASAHACKNETADKLAANQNAYGPVKFFEEPPARWGFLRLRLEIRLLLLGVLNLPQTIFAAFRYVLEQVVEFITCIAVQSILCSRPGGQIRVGVDKDEDLGIADYGRTNTT